LKNKKKHLKHGTILIMISEYSMNPKKTILFLAEKINENPQKKLFSQK
jgi:hypothetical protein